MRPAPLRERLATVGASVRSQSALRERDGWSRSQLEAFQRDRLEQIVRHAAAHSPLYREALGPIEGPVDLRALPVVRKPELMERWDDWVTDPHLRRAEAEPHLAALGGDELLHGEYRIMATGGSTGTRGVFAFSRPEWHELVAHFMAMLNGLGMTPRLPKRRRVASIAAPTPAHMTWRITASIDIGLHKRVALAATTPLPELVAQLNAFRPDFLNAYPSVGALLADEQLAGRLRIAPTVVSTSSELCTPEMRERIRAAWGVEPHEIYGATDGLWGSSCEHGRLHFWEDMTIVEAEDERLLITNLFMRTQPVIRYEVTDMVRLHDGPCPCGRPTRTVSAIEGRSDDILGLPADGGGTVRVHPIHLRSPLAQLESVRAYQAVLRDDGLHVRVVPRGEAAASEVHAAMSGALAKAGAGATPVHVEVAEELQRDSTGVGKLKLVRSEVSGQTLASAGTRA